MADRTFTLRRSTTVLISVFVATTLAVMAYGLTRLLDLTQKFEEESKARSVSNCRAINRSTKTLAEVLDIFIPKGQVFPPDQQDRIDRARRLLVLIDCDKFTEEQLDQAMTNFGAVAEGTSALAAPPPVVNVSVPAAPAPIVRPNFEIIVNDAPEQKPTVIVTQPPPEEEPPPEDPPNQPPAVPPPPPPPECILEPPFPCFEGAPQNVVPLAVFVNPTGR